MQETISNTAKTHLNEILTKIELSLQVPAVNETLAQDIETLRNLNDTLGNRGTLDVIELDEINKSIQGILSSTALSDTIKNELLPMYKGFKIETVSVSKDFLTDSTDDSDTEQTLSVLLVTLKNDFQTDFIYGNMSYRNIFKNTIASIEGLLKNQQKDIDSDIKLLENLDVIKKIVGVTDETLSLINLYAEALTEQTNLAIDSEEAVVPSESTDYYQDSVENVINVDGVVSAVPTEDSLEDYVEQEDIPTEPVTESVIRSTSENTDESVSVQNHNVITLVSGEKKELTFGDTDTIISALKHVMSDPLLDVEEEEKYRELLKKIIS